MFWFITAALAASPTQVLLQADIVEVCNAHWDELGDVGATDADRIMALRRSGPVERGKRSARLLSRPNLLVVAGELAEFSIGADTSSLRLEMVPTIDGPEVLVGVDLWVKTGGRTYDSELHLRVADGASATFMEGDGCELLFRLTAHPIDGPEDMQEVQEEEARARDAAMKRFDDWDDRRMHRWLMP